jgi:hypothetical protein
MPFNITCVIFICQGVWSIYFQVNANNKNPYAIYGPGLSWPGLAGLGLGWAGWAGAGAGLAGLAGLGLGWAGWAGLAGLGLGLGWGY